MGGTGSYRPVPHFAALFTSADRWEGLAVTDQCRILWPFLQCVGCSGGKTCGPGTWVTADAERVPFDEMQLF